MTDLNPRRLAQLLLLGTVLVWGASFAIVKSALTDASPFVFNLLRMTLAAAALIAINHRHLRALTRPQLAGGALAGVFLATGYQFQTLGLAHTTAAKSAFITGLVVVLVPLLMILPAVRPPGTRRPGLLAIVGALVAFAGLILLTTPPGTPPSALFTSISAGDLLTTVCALAYAGHLLTLARISPGMPAGPLATVQISAAAVFMLLTLPLEHTHRLTWTPRLAIALAVTSLLATAAAFTIQSYAQQHLPPAQTAVLLTMEPVFAALTSVLLLHEALSIRSLAGSALILISIAAIEVLPSLLHATEIPA